MITIPLFKEHHILTQVAGHGMNVVKLLPPLTLNEKDRDNIIQSFDKTIAETHQIPGSIWDLGKNLASHALKSKKRVTPIYAGKKVTTLLFCFEQLLRVFKPMNKSSNYPTLSNISSPADVRKLSKNS